MSGHRGSIESFTMTSREMDENECDCEVDGSFIIIPKQNRERVSLASPPNDISITESGMERSVNVFQLGQQITGGASMQTQKGSAFESSTAASAPPEQDKEVEVEVSALRLVQNQDVMSGQSVPSTSNVTNSFTSSVSSEAGSLEEANTMLNELSVENQKLKVLLTDRNENMKRSLDTYKNLQTAMASIHEDHKMKYDESRSVIEQLRQENLKLRTELIEKENNIIECSNALTSSTKAGTKELGKFELLEKQWTSSKEEVSRLNRQLAEHIQLISDASMEREQLKDLLRRKEAELTGAKACAINASDYRMLQGERDMLHTAFEDSRITVEELNKNRLKKDEELKQMSQNLQNTENQLERVKKELEAHRDDSANLKSAFDKKVDAFIELARRLEISDTFVEQLQRELKIRENELRSLKTVVDGERKTFAHAAETLTEKDRENSLLHTQMALFKTQEEQTELYKTQMEEYKSNFEEERRDRVSMKEQKDQLADELTRVKMELERKSIELEKLHRTHLELANEHLESAPAAVSSSDSNDKSEASKPKSNSFGQQVTQVFDFVTREVFGSGSRNGGRGGASAASAPQNEGSPQRDDQCPLCQKTFSTRGALVNHASHCGDVPKERSRGTFVFP